MGISISFATVIDVSSVSLDFCVVGIVVMEAGMVKNTSNHRKSFLCDFSREINNPEVVRNEQGV